MKKPKTLADVLLIQNAWAYRKTSRRERESTDRYMAGFHYASYLTYRNVRSIVKNLSQFESIIGKKI